MNPETAPESPEVQPRELLAWHKPEIQHLVVNFDTANDTGSGTDSETHGIEFTSDRRLKQDILAIRGALNGILALNGVTYLYDTATYPELRLAAGPQIGFIAQELEHVYPELVTTRENGFRAVNYAQLVPVLVEAIKEQQAMIEELRDQIAELRPVSAVGTL
jgi:hypothetical protein